MGISEGECQNQDQTRKKRTKVISLWISTCAEHVDNIRNVYISKEHFMYFHCMMFVIF